MWHLAIYTARYVNPMLMCRIPLVGLVGLIFLTVCLSADPASNVLTEMSQPDGSVVKLRHVGSPWYHWHETEEGYTVGRDEGDGYWKHTQLDRSSMTLRLLPTAVVGKVKPELLGLKKRDIPTPMDMQKITTRLRGGRYQDAKGSKVLLNKVKMPSAPVQQALRSSPSVSGGATSLSAPVAAPSASPAIDKQTLKGLVILASFTDHWTGSTVMASKGKTRADYDDMFNEPGYSTGTAVGSVRDFYLDASYGDLEIDFTVLDWLVLPNTEAWYGDDANETNGDARFRSMGIDAVYGADAAGVDFSQFDGNNDGWVDLLIIVYSGHGQNNIGVPQYTLWPKTWWFKSVFGDQGVLTLDGVQLYRFCGSNALRGDLSSTDICGIGVICHEMGHLFGLPDLYDLTYATEGIGRWGLMGYGSWGATGTNRDRPVGMTSVCKHMMGFLEPEVMHTTTGATLSSIDVNPEAHIIHDGFDNHREFFMLENRQATGYYSNLPEGILTWHVSHDYGSNDSAESHFAVRLEEANGGDSLSVSSTASLGHAWTNVIGLIGGLTDTSGISHTNAMQYQAALYDRADDLNYYTYNRFTNFSTPGPTMTYDLQTLVPTVASESDADGNYAVNWEASSDATHYEIQEGTYGTTNFFLDSAENRTQSHRNWDLSGQACVSSVSGNTGSNCYIMSVRNDQNTAWMAEIQAMTLREPFTLLAGTEMSFYLMSDQSTFGYLKVQVSNDDGVTWSDVGSYIGGFFVWTRQSINFANFSAAGISDGDSCRVRFLAYHARAYGWGGFPYYGYAVDDIQLTNIIRPAYLSWNVLDNNYAGTSYPVTGKTQGDYAYRVRAFAAGEWQEYSLPALISVSTPYDSWEAANGITGSGRATDVDGDAQLNEFEYFFGLDPNNARNTRMPSAAINSNAPTFQYTYRTDDPGLTYTVETSMNLTAWSNASTTVITGPSDNGDGTSTVTLRSTVNFTTQPRQFFRVRVAE